MTADPAVKPPAQKNNLHLVTQGAHKNSQRRHTVLRWSFVVVVLMPTAIAAIYLWLVAADQYSSKASFAVRSEEYQSPLEALGAFTQIGASSASDAQVLYDFIKSQPLIEQVDANLDLRKIYAHPRDIVFSLRPTSSIEDIIRYWDRMVYISIDSGSGVLSLEVKAFSPDEARQVAEEVIRLSGSLVDDLSRIARDDATRFAREEVMATEERLKEIRLALNDFRIENDTIDPSAIVSSQMGVVAALQNSLAEALVERGTILGFASVEDQRIRNLDARIAAIREQISSERQLLATNDEGLTPLVEMMGAYQELLVDLEFSQNAYTAALAAQQQANAEARRKSRYLAMHIPPTTAQDSLYPQREFLTLLIFIGALAMWAVAVLVYYNIRDRS